MSFTKITTCTRSSSSPIIRVFSKHRVRETDPGNFDSKTSLLKLNCAGSESDGEYETSSEGQLHPGPETCPSLCTTRKSGPTIVNNETFCKAEVSTELRLEVDGSTKNNENSAKAEDFGNTSKDSISPQPELTKVLVHPIDKIDEVVPSFLETRFSSEVDRSTWCFLSDSRQTLQSMDTKSNLALSTAKTSTTDLQSIYKEKKFQSDSYSYSIETDSVYKTEQNRFQFFEKHKRFSDGGNTGLLKSTQAPIDIGTNPELSFCSIHATRDKTNANCELKTNLIKRSHIISQIDKELAPLRDKINQIFNKVRIDLTRVSLDNCPKYENLSGISKSGYFSSKVNSTLQSVLHPVSCHSLLGTSIIENPLSSSLLPSLPNTPSTKYKLDLSNSYCIKKNYIPETLLPSQERLQLNENVPYHPLKCMNHLGTYSCTHNVHLPRHFENCHHIYLNNELVALKNTHLQDSVTSNSLYSLPGHQVPHVANNSQHISLSDFPIVRQHLHSFHANVLPVNLENLHRHCRSKVSSDLETSDFKAHTESKNVSNQNNVEHAKKHRVSCRSRHRHSVNKKESRENDSSLKNPLSHGKRCKKCDSVESSNRPRPFSGRRRCKCKRHHRDLRHKMNQSLSPADNSPIKSLSPEPINISIRVENQSSSNNDITRQEILSFIEEPSQLITELNTLTKEIVPIAESLSQQKQDPEFVQISSSSSKNTITSERKCPLKNSNLLKHSLMDFSNLAKARVLEIEKSSYPKKISDSVQENSSSILTCCRHINRHCMEHKGLIQVTEHNAICDKGCNTESIEVPVYQKKNLLHLEKPTLNTSTKITKKSQIEILKSEISNFNQPLKVGVSKERINITSLQSQVSKKGSRESISNQHSKMSFPKTHERITIVPIIFSSGMPEPLNENFDFTSSEKSGNTHQKQIPLNVESQGKSLSDSDFSLSTRAESFATEITALAKKCAFISDSKERINSRMTLNTANSSYSILKPLGSQIRDESNTKASNESRTKVASSRSSMSYETFENSARNTVTVRRIRGIRTSPEDFMYE